MQYIFYNARNINMIGCVFFVTAWTITRFFRGKTLFHLSHLGTLFSYLSVLTADCPLLVHRDSQIHKMCIYVHIIGLFMFLKKRGITGQQQREHILGNIKRFQVFDVIYACAFSRMWWTFSVSGRSSESCSMILRSTSFLNVAG